VRSWLYRITTNACLRALERRPARVLPIDYGPPADPHDQLAAPLVETVWVEPLPDEQLAVDAAYEQREAVELAFIAALQHLPARQRAVLILRDVLGFSAREVAESLDTTPVSIDSALQRAHKAVDQRMPEHTQQATLHALGDDTVRATVDRYRDAWERADVDALKAMLTDDAVFAMPPHAAWFRGPEAIGEFLRRLPMRPGRRERVVPMRANGQVAFAHYASLHDAPFTLHAVGIASFRGAEIAELTYFRSPDVLARFGLRETVD
jgi:RNA polymerase sigma-70 factor (ECF subfamily)